jgi:hypothetical protein|tara:strand:+ start:3912 stop:4403 length:492 start_codon:yes stop_codon:yes gene_type:complete
MTSFLKSALNVVDLDSNLNYVEIKYTKWNYNSNTYEDFTDYLYTSSKGDWTEITCSKQDIQYENFLQTMVEKTIESTQRMALIALDNLLARKNLGNHDVIRIMNTCKIVNPTFKVPYINKNNTWQIEFARGFIRDYLPDAIECCLNKKRLSRMFTVLKLIDEQ